MSKEIMERRAADNEYLHKDFHGALSAGIDYLADHYGIEGIKEYLRRFAKTYYSPLIEEFKKRGLVALKEHFARIYAIEGGSIGIDCSEDELVLKVEACPAVMHMRGHGYAVSPYFIETIRTVNEALCEGTDFAFELIEYDEETGKSIQRFFRRAA
ncbi:MAG: hypothetical protein ACYC4F_09885 [Armatimonadota bacterium]